MAGAREPDAKRPKLTPPVDVQARTMAVPTRNVEARPPPAVQNPPRRPDIPTCSDAVVSVLPLMRAVIVYVKHELRLRLRENQTQMYAAFADAERGPASGLP